MKLCIISKKSFYILLLLVISGFNINAQQPVYVGPRGISWRLVLAESKKRTARKRQPGLYTNTEWPCGT